MSEAIADRLRRILTHPIYLLPAGCKRAISWRQTISQSGLPEAVQQLIARVVGRTRLWRSEKGEVAAELVAHFADGVDAGASAQELLGGFGDARIAAKLIRRAKRRNRPLWWQIRHRLTQAVGTLVLLYAGSILLLVWSHPAPSVDYVAQINGAMTAAPESDRAWPLYRQAWTQCKIWDFNDAPLMEADHPRRFLKPGDAGWPAVAGFLQQYQPLLEASRQAAGRPWFGWPLRAGGMEAISPEDRIAFKGTDALSPPSSTSNGRLDELTAGSMMMILLPYLSHMRHTAVVLAADMRLAASQNDTDRILADYRAMTGLARHAGQTPILVNQLVGLSILALADTAVMEINRDTPAVLATCRVDLLHTMAAVPSTLKIDFSGERWSVLDTIQRIYSDDGKGDGHITADGLQLLVWFSRSTREIANLPNGWGPASAVLPAAAVLMPSRKELTRQLESYFDVVQEDQSRPLWVRLREPGRAESMVRRWREPGLRRVQYAVPSLLVGSFDRAGLAFDQARAVHEAAMVALAMEAYRANAGGYPATLAELTPHYLPTLPLDYSTGHPLRYKLVDGHPLLYGLGKDGVDDGGVWTDKKNPWPHLPDTGDWVLYPPVLSDD